MALNGRCRIPLRALVSSTRIAELSAKRTEDPANLPGDWKKSPSTRRSPGAITTRGNDNGTHFSRSFAGFDGVEPYGHTDPAGQRGRSSILRGGWPPSWFLRTPVVFSLATLRTMSCFGIRQLTNCRVIAANGRLRCLFELHVQRILCIMGGLKTKHFQGTSVWATPSKPIQKKLSAENPHTESISLHFMPPLSVHDSPSYCITTPCL